MLLVNLSIMNKTLGIVLAVVVIVGGIYVFTRAPKSNYTNSSPSSLSEAQKNQATSEQGRVVFSITDAAADMNTISEITLKVNSVDMHSTTKGWVVVSTTPSVYNLLTLNAKNVSEFLAYIDTKADTFDQVRLMIDSISVKTKAGVVNQAKLPSGELKINTTLVMKAGTTSSVNFDFLAAKSLHMTGAGQYIFAPVVKTQVKSNATVNIDSGNIVTIVNGQIDSEGTAGMDIDGSVKSNFEINNTQKLKLDTGGIIRFDNLVN
jgi:hypothetical protein